MKNIILYGASGHAKVLLPILQRDRFNIIALIDRNPTVKPFLQTSPIFKSIDDLFLDATFLQIYKNEPISFCIAIGGIYGLDRVEIHNKLLELNIEPITLVHTRAWVADTATLASGCQVLGMSAVSEYAEIGLQTIINTSASVDHETVIGQGCHVMPGATIAGCVTIGDFCTIGSNATILPRIKIGNGAIIGAGAVVTKDVTENSVVVGIPARTTSLTK